MPFLLVLKKLVFTELLPGSPIFRAPVPGDVKSILDEGLSSLAEAPGGQDMAAAIP